MLLHGGGTRRLANPAQRQPESNLLLEPAKQNTYFPFRSHSRKAFQPKSQKESLVVSFGIVNLSHHLPRLFHGPLSLTQDKK